MVREGLLFDFVFGHFVVEEAAVDLKTVGGIGFVAGRVFEGGEDEVFLEFGDGFVEGE